MPSAYVHQVQTLYAPDRMPRTAAAYSSLAYTKVLRMDEAMNEITPLR
jgi:hypothetical protein